MNETGASSPLPEPPPPGSPADAGLSALAWAVSSGEAGTVMQQLRAKRQRRQRRWIAAMSVGAAVLVGAMFTWQSRLRPAPTAQNVATLAPAVVSAPATQALPDGTVVDLNAGARITVDFSASLRRVVLERGEAHFQVAKDHTRTFVVAVDGVEVRAVGTAFAVQRRDAAVDVLVTEGRVAIDQTDARDRPADASPSPHSPPVGIATTAQTIAMLDAGHRVTVPLAAIPAAAPVVQPVSEAETTQRLAWRVPRLEFSGMALGEAIPLFNRHSARHLVLDPTLAQLQVSGNLRADDTDSLLLLLKNEFGIEAEARGDNEIVLRRSGSGSHPAP
jgi:transmembrane sensor